VSGDWRIYKNGKDAGHFDYQIDAVEAALRMIKKAEASGHRAYVLVQDRAGQLNRLDPDGRHG